MNELLTALVAAQKVGFDAPECPDCHKSRSCPTCRGTFLDASDPFGLIGRALMALQFSEPQFKRHGMFAGPVVHLGDPNCSATVSGHHDGTPTGLATALLRLVARVGGAS